LTAMMLRRGSARVVILMTKPRRQDFRADRIPLLAREEAEARQAKTLTAAEARRIAINITRLPELLGRGERD
jgi:hypothetical protein